MMYHALPIRWTSFRGAKATDVLNGLVTNDVATLAVGGAQLAAALSPKGKLVCDMYIVRLADDVLLTGVLESAADAWFALVRKYVNPRLCTVTDESSAYRTLVVFGEQAGRIMPQLRDEVSRGDLTLDLIAAPLVSSPLPGVAAASLLLVHAHGEGRLLARLADHGVAAGTADGWQTARVEAGLPLFGVDMDENTIPQEANLDALGAISFTKGCYTGQETVARIHFRGHVNRHLRGLTAEQPLERGQVVLDANGKPVGDVRSTAVSPAHGPIAIAMVRREVNPGDTVTVESATGPRPATVHLLPFASAAVR